MLAVQASSRTNNLLKYLNFGKTGATKQKLCSLALFTEHGGTSFVIICNFMPGDNFSYMPLILGDLYLPLLAGVASWLLVGVLVGDVVARGRLLLALDGVILMTDGDVALSLMVCWLLGTSFVRLDEDNDDDEEEEEAVDTLDALRPLPLLPVMQEKQTKNIELEAKNVRKALFEIARLAAHISC